MTVTPVAATTLELLEASFAGELVRPGDARYDLARAVHNGLIDMRPAVIARCLGVADVVAALAAARECGLEVAVRGGGHSVAGLSSTNGGLVVDLGAMKGIHVEPATRRARVQPGVTWREFNRETALFGLAVTGGTVSSTGVAGLTLGGGFGWLMGAHGLAADNLLSAQVVTAGGDVLIVDPTQSPDLFWAIRGGGGNFGVVTSFEFGLHPVAEVTGGLVAHPLDDAHVVLRAFRELAGAAPDELGLVAALVHAPDGSGVPLAALAVCHAGEAARAERELAPVVELGSPVMTEIGRMPYPAMNTLLDAAYPAGALNYWKSSFLDDLPDTAVDLLVERFATSPSPMTIVAIEAHHGAATRVGVRDTAVPHRVPGFNVLITSVWTDPARTEENVEWTRDLYDELQPFLAPRRYGNYLSSDDASAAREAFGPNYDRLAEIKRRYDPDNMFRRNVNVPPVPAAP